MGKKLSEEHKQNISKSKKGKKGKKHTGETKRKISDFRKGRKHTGETKQKLSEVNRGEKHPQWKGGHTRYYGSSWSSQRRKALKRDHYTCQKCRFPETNGREVSVHHIIRFMEFGVERHIEANNLSNLITLCEKCHHIVEYDPHSIDICKAVAAHA